VPHLVLLGDSILDNGSYTAGGPDVLSQMRSILPPDWRASLAAVDGATTYDIPAQLARIARDASHLALSIGGNDALKCLPVLDQPVSVASEAFMSLRAIAVEFEFRYATALDACLARRLPIAVCTIYNGCFSGVTFQELATLVIAVFNDVILRAAARHALPVIDLRAVCSSPEDYANPIEPSSIGGAKIAKAIAAVVTGEGGLVPATRVTLR
jgi:hypothetical protein